MVEDYKMKIGNLIFSFQVIRKTRILLVESIH